jgi:replicative DNA helicase
MQKVYDISNEDLVIRKFFEDTTLQHRIAPHFSEDVFKDPANKKICEWILRYHKKYNRYPSAQELVTALPACTQRTKLINICNRDIQPMENSYVIDQIETFFQVQQTTNILTDAAEAIHERDFTNINTLIKGLQNAVNFSLHIDGALDVVADTDEALRRLNESMRAIPSALEDIRAFTSNGTGYGGHYRKALTIFMGMPNVGKSIVLCNEAAFAFQRGYNVMYITLEMAEELIWERITSNITDVPMNEVRVSNGADLKRLLTTVPDKDVHDVGNLVVKALPTTATVVDIENEIIEIKRTKGFDIDMLVVDYIGIMKPAKRANGIGSHTLYTMGKEIAEQLRDMAKAREIAVVTASQLNRDGYGSKEASMENVAGSAGLNDTADLMITITQDPLLKEHHLFYHMILKNRFGPNMINSMSKCDYSHMRVRSASNNDIKQYSEMQISQDGNADSFTSRTSDLRGSIKAPSKSREEIEAQVEKMNELKNKDLKTEKITEVEILPVQETILDSNENGNKNPPLQTQSPQETGSPF